MTEERAEVYAERIEDTPSFLLELLEQDEYMRRWEGWFVSAE